MFLFDSVDFEIDIFIRLPFFPCKCYALSMAPRNEGESRNSIISFSTATLSLSLYLSVRVVPLFAWHIDRLDVPFTFFSIRITCFFSISLLFSVFMRRFGLHIMRFVCCQSKAIDGTHIKLLCKRYGGKRE